MINLIKKKYNYLQKLIDSCTNPKTLNENDKRMSEKIKGMICCIALWIAQALSSVIVEVSARTLAPVFYACFAEENSTI